MKKEEIKKNYLEVDSSAQKPVRKASEHPPQRHKMYDKLQRKRSNSVNDALRKYKKKRSKRILGKEGTVDRLPESFNKYMKSREIGEIEEERKSIQDINKAEITNNLGGLPRSALGSPVRSVHSEDVGEEALESEGEEEGNNNKNSNNNPFEDGKLLGVKEGPKLRASLCRISTPKGGMMSDRKPDEGKGGVQEVSQSHSQVVSQFTTVEKEWVEYVVGENDTITKIAFLHQMKYVPI